MFVIKRLGEASLRAGRNFSPPEIPETEVETTTDPQSATMIKLVVKDNSNDRVDPKQGIVELCAEASEAKKETKNDIELSKLGKNDIEGGQNKKDELANSSTSTKSTRVPPSVLGQTHNRSLSINLSPAIVITPLETTPMIFNEDHFTGSAGLLSVSNANIFDDLDSEFVSITTAATESTSSIVPPVGTAVPVQFHLSPTLRTITSTNKIFPTASEAASAAEHDSRIIPNPGLRPGGKYYPDEWFLSHPSLRTVFNKIPKREDMSFYWSCFLRYKPIDAKEYPVGCFFGKGKGLRPVYCRLPEPHDTVREHILVYLYARQRYPPGYIEYSEEHPELVGKEDVPICRCGRKMGEGA